VLGDVAVSRVLGWLVCASPVGYALQERCADCLGLLGRRGALSQDVELLLEQPLVALGLLLVVL
jgi:hypothetical protein